MNDAQGPASPPAGRIGVLLINLGTPDRPEPGAIRRYLRQFLSDPRVVEIPRLVWQPILHGLVLTTRPRKSAHAYRQVWTEEGSPLAAITARQKKALAGTLGPEVEVAHAMRYGAPAIAETIDVLRAKGCDRILVAPLYPHYCAATTATANDAVFLHLAGLRSQPALRTLPPYYRDPLYIDALAGSVEESLATLPFAPQLLVASFHGMPQRTVALGDPYHDQCHETVRLLRERVALPVRISFQSRFGRAKWIEPATDKLLAGLPAEGVENVAVIAPGFSADCLETLEELAIRGRDTFLAAGGRNFGYISCLNDSVRGMALLRALLGRQLQGWIGQT